jgi:glutamate synthase (NADPH/NADH) large chain
VGVATQDPVLRARFTGQPEHVINYFFFVAEELREIMASLGVRKLTEMIGRPELLDAAPAVEHWKARGIDLSKLLYVPAVDPALARWNSETQMHGLDRVFDRELIAAAAPALERGEKVVIEREVRNVNRSVGTMLSGEVARRYGHEGLPDDSIYARLRGTVGQSFGAFLAKGVTLELTGDANDYVGKGLSGGRIIVRQPQEARRDSAANIIVGNTVLYGAIEGEAFFNGVGGERFAVRNSGATAVVEGAGDHACEYMTGGVVAILGPVGRNFAAGMSGGVAYVYDPEGQLEAQCNLASVELESVPDTSDPNADLADMLAHDAERLRGLVERHFAATGSAQAQALLDDWPAALAKFVKVMPTEYRRALLDLRAENLIPLTVAAE